MNNTAPLSLKRLLLSNPWGFAIPLLVGALASLAGVVLLGISGWFISAAGVAASIGTSLVFNYLTPGAIVRGMAILRTTGRYGEQLMSHSHLLELLRTLRLWVWDQLVKKSAVSLRQQSKGDLLHRVVSDLDHIIRWPLVVLLPWMYALLSYMAVAIFAYIVFSALLIPVCIAALLHMLIIPFLCARMADHAVHKSYILGVYRRSRFVSLFSALITLTIRGHWQDYALRLTQLDEKQRTADSLIQRAVSLGRLLTYCTSIALLTTSFYLIGMNETGANIWALHVGIKGPWVIGYVLSILALNELVLPLSQSFVAQGQSRVGLRRLNQLQEQDKPNIRIKSDKAMSSGLEDINNMTFSQWRAYHASNNMGHSPLTFSVAAGDHIWFRGRSGAGKSTLLSGIAGDCLSSGEVLINGTEQCLFENRDVQSRLSYLSQSPYIFQQSISANLRLGDACATDENLWAVLKAVALDDWVKALPEGLKTLLYAHGRNLSGGQRRRLALARLLLRRSPILLLDEPFDGLDKSTINSICNALQNEYRPSILLLVSHIETPLGQQARIIEL